MFCSFIKEIVVMTEVLDVPTRLVCGLYIIFVIKILRLLRY